MIFDYCTNCTQNPTPLTREIFESLIKEEWVLQIAAQVAAGHLDKKRNLPAACWQASFQGQKRSNVNAQHSGLFALDVDHIEDPDVLYASFEDRIPELGIYIVHKTPSTKGIRIVAACREGLSTIGENQEWMAREIGVQHDAVTRDLARLSFLVPESYFYHYNPQVFEDEANVVLANSAYYTKGQSLCVIPDTYDGIPYTLLVEALANQLGGVPVHGSRNNFLFSMACHLRYVCNDDPEWIRQVLPTYGEDPGKVARTVQSACNRAQSRVIPAIVQRAISVARGQVNALQLGNSQSASGTLNPISASEPPPLPKRLPKLIQLLVSKVDPMYRPAVAQAVFPPLGAHLHGVRTRYIDNSENDLGGFMSVCMAKQSIGKGSVNMPIEFIMEDIRTRDNYNRELERQWKAQCKQAKANDKKPARPEGIFVQYLMSNMTNAAMVQRLIDADEAGGWFLYVRLDELELLDQIKATGGATSSEIIRLTFTQSRYGQERVGTESVSGTPPLRLNINASTTIEAGKYYFRNGLTNGTLSRVTFSTIIKPVGQRGIPRFGDYDEPFRKALYPYICNLNAASGLVECKQAEKMALKLMDENYDLAELSDDDVFETLSYRANRIVYDKAMLLYIAHGYQWSKEIADFCRWSEQYDLWCKMHFFGQSIREKLKQEQAPQVFGPQNMLDLLPDRFSSHDLQAVHKAQGHDGNVMQLIYTWTNRGHIQQDAATQEYIKTAQYLAKHKSVNS